MKKIIKIIYVILVKFFYKNIKITLNSSVRPETIRRIGRKKNIIISGGQLGAEVEIDEGVKIFKRVVCGGKIKIGRYTTLNGDSTLISGRIYGIKIGSFVSIAPGVKILEEYHKYERVTSYFIGKHIFNEKSDKNEIYSKGEINIEDDVWIGTNSVILSGVTIGRSSIVGAGSVVTKDIPPYSIAVGNPAKVIKKRFSEETIKMLKESKWWLWDIEKIKRNKEFFLKELK